MVVVLGVCVCVWRGGISHASFMSSTPERQGRTQVAPRAGVPRPSQRKGSEESGWGHELDCRLLSVATLSHGPLSTHPFVAVLWMCDKIHCLRRTWE